MRAKDIRGEGDSNQQRTVSATRPETRPSIAHWNARWAAAAIIVALLSIGTLLAARALSQHPTGARRGAAVTTTFSPGVDLLLPNVSLPPFVCRSEGMGSGTTGRPVALVRAMGTAAQGGYDRLVMEFGGGLPTGNIEVRSQSGTAFTSSPSGKPINLAGTNSILLVIHGADLHTSYHGPSDLVTRLATLKEVRVVEDFEGVVQLGLGLDGPACYRAILANNPDRLVIDVQSK